MTETRETYQTIHREYMTIRAGLQAEFAPADISRRLAQLETTRTELLEAIDRLESQRRSDLKKYQELKEAAWSVCATSNYQQVDQSALRRLADLIDFPGWHSL